MCVSSLEPDPRAYVMCPQPWECSRGRRRVSVRPAVLLLTSVLQVVVVLLILDRQMGLAAQGPQGQQAGARSGHRRQAWGLEA